MGAGRQFTPQRVSSKNRAHPAREHDPERRPLFAARAHVDGAAVRADDLIHDEQPEPDAGDRGVDADHPPERVRQGAPGVARVESGVGLDHVLEDAGGAPALGRERAAEPADHSGGHRPGQAQRAAHRHDQLADAQRLGVAEPRGPRCAAASADHREIRQRIGTDDVELGLGAVGEGCGSAVSTADHVCVGDDETVVVKPDAGALTQVHDFIFLDHVGFHDYHEEAMKEALQDVYLTIRRGEVIALVGPSGAGKSTLVSLIPRFFDVTSGRVLIDGHDLRDVTLASLRHQIATVTQETILFNDTVRNNIAYGQPDVNHERILEAAKAALAHNFIEQMPDGYNTVIGEKGFRLSGGERQRLAIARAILKNAPILILDEATSALDAESESRVQTALANLMQDRTSIVIAHRLSTVRRADRIAVIEAGRITAIGSHEELLFTSPTYQKLYKLQFMNIEPTKVPDLPVSEAAE